MKTNMVWKIAKNVFKIICTGLIYLSVCSSREMPTYAKNIYFIISLFFMDFRLWHIPLTKALLWSLLTSLKLYGMIAVWSLYMFLKCILEWSERGALLCHVNITLCDITKPLYHRLLHGKAAGTWIWPLTSI